MIITGLHAQNYSKKFVIYYADFLNGKMFYNTEINKVKEEFRRLKLAPEHRKIVDDVAQIVLVYFNNFFIA